MKNTIFKKVNPENCSINYNGIKVLTQNIYSDEDVEILDVKIVDKKTDKTIFEADSVIVKAPISNDEWDALELYCEEYDGDEVYEAWDNVLDCWEDNDGEYESELEQMLYEDYCEYLDNIFDDWLEGEYELYEHEGTGAVVDIINTILEEEGYDGDVVYTVSANGSVNIYQFDYTYNEKTYEEMYLLTNIKNDKQKKICMTQIK